MRALTWTRPGTVEVTERAARRAPDGDVTVRVTHVGICGTDLHIIDGQHPRARPPLVLGHEIVGVLATPTPVLAAGTPVAVTPTISCGECQACRNELPWVCDRLRLIGIDRDGGAAEQVVVPSGSVRAIDVSLELERAAFFEPLAVAVHAVRRGKVELGDRVLVAGAGPIGRAIADVSLLAGASDVILTESNRTRADRARTETRFEVVDAEDALTSISSEGRGIDVLFDSAGHPTVARQATRLVRAGGRVVVAAVYGSPTTVDLQEVNFREIEITGTRVYEDRDVDTALGLLSDGRFDPTSLITMASIDTFSSAMADLRAGGILKLVLEVQREH